MEYEIEFTGEELDEIRKILIDEMYNIYSSYDTEQVFSVFKDTAVQTQYMNEFKDYERMDALIKESIDAFSENNRGYDSNSIIFVSFSEDDCASIERLLRKWIEYRELWNIEEEKYKRSLRLMKEINDKLNKNKIK